MQKHTELPRFRFRHLQVHFMIDVPVSRRCYTMQFSQQLAEELHSVTCLYLCNLATCSLRATLHEVELSSTVCNDCSNFQSPLHSATLPSSNLCRNALLDQPIRILIILSSVLLRRSFASCWQSHCSVTPCSCNCNATLLNVARQVAQKIV